MTNPVQTCCIRVTGGSILWASRNPGGTHGVFSVAKTF